MTAKVRFLHSTGTGPAMWERTIALLGHLDIDAEAVPNLGYAPGPAIARGDTVGVDDHVAHLARALTDGTDEPLHLVAHSFGAFLALKLLLATEPAAIPVAARVRSLWIYEPVLFGALALTPEAKGDALVGESWLVRDEARGGSDPWLGYFVDYWSGEGSFAKIPESMRAPMRKLGWTMFQEVRATALDPAPFADYRVACALTLACGARSPAASRAMIDALAIENPHAVVDRREGLAHMAPVGRPRDVVPSIEAHLLRAGLRPRAT